MSYCLKSTLLMWLLIYWYVRLTVHDANSLCYSNFSTSQYSGMCVLALKLYDTRSKTVANSDETDVAYGTHEALAKTWCPALPSAD